MKLQTQIPIAIQTDAPIDYNSKILLLGSCFVENIGRQLDYYKFQNFKNPFGILFHPLAIERLIVNAVQAKTYTASDLFFHNDQWHCFDAHSKLSHSDAAVLLKSLNDQVDRTAEYISNASHLVITLGTAWIYTHLETDKSVANCFKLPQKDFSKALLPLDEIYNALVSILLKVKKLNKDIKVIFTLSPVRHIKDGFVENSRSKAHLLTAIHQVVDDNTQTERSVSYFPSYEIMMEELRDYRFYNEDMLHPSNLAVNYIWNNFTETWMHSSAKRVMQLVDDIQKGMQHRAFNPNTEQHQNFLKKLEFQKTKLQSEYKHIEF